MSHAEHSPGERPFTVEVAGGLGDLELALVRVDDLGTVTFAGPPLASDSTIDLYADLHVRGLTVVFAPGERETGG